MSATPTTVGGGDIVTLDGTAADADNDTLTYAWASSGGGTFGNASLLDTDWEAPTVIGKMVVTLTLTVSDGIVDTVVRQDITVVPIAPHHPAALPRRADQSVAVRLYRATTH